MDVSTSAPLFPPSLLARLDTTGPRYTSYPTADRFVDAFGPEQYEGALRQRAQGATIGGRSPLSVYVHIPFCESVCYYCACNKVVTRHHERAAQLRTSKDETTDRIASCESTISRDSFAVQFRVDQK